MSKLSRSAVVVGGGPTGLIAAETLADAGVQVEVVEHSRSVGRKFLLAGRGGLNITNETDIETFLSNYRGDSEPVLDAIRRFPPDALRQWCEDLGEPTIAGSSGHVFPQSFRATPLLRAWLHRLTEAGVRLTTQCSFDGWLTDGTAVYGDGIERSPDVLVLAMGGASWPRTGSDGGWVDGLERAGHSVRTLEPSNAGLTRPWTEVHRSRFAGRPIKNVVVSAGELSARGDVVITDTGLEGGPIYALGAAVRSGERVLAIDLVPDQDVDRLQQRLTTKKRPKDSISTWLRRAGLPPATVSLLREATANQIPADPAELAALMKQMRLRIEGLAAIEKAISSAGGVRLDEIDSHFMLTSRPGTFVAGEMLDWDAPTGGFLLQACFSTGVAAANGAIEYLQRQPS